jgi:hypothetical protein
MRILAMLSSHIQSSASNSWSSSAMLYHPVLQVMKQSGMNGAELVT